MKTMKMNNGAIETNVKVNGDVVKLFTEEADAYKEAVLLAAKDAKSAKVPYSIEVDVANPSGRIIDTLYGIVFTSGLAPTALTLPNGKIVEWKLVGKTAKSRKNTVLETEFITGYKLTLKYPQGGYTAQNYNHLVALTGLSGSAWCREFDIAEQTYYKHKSEYRTMNLNSWYELVEAVESYLTKK